MNSEKWNVGLETPVSSTTDGVRSRQILLIGLYEHVKNDIIQTRDIYKIVRAAGEYIQFALRLFFSRVNMLFHVLYAEA